MAKEITLLQKAKAIKLSKRKGKGGITQDHVELIVAMLKGEITTRQVAEVLELKPGSVQQSCTPILRWGVQNGIIEIKWLKK